MIEQFKKTILLVEDEAVTARITSRILEKNGYEVIHAHTGEEAVSITSKGDAVDLILMDIDMGQGIDGTSAASQILRKQDIPVIFLSAHSDPEFVQKTEKITSYGYVLKNSGETVLLTSINMALKLYYANREIAENEARLNALIENISDVIVIIDKYGIIKYQSENVEKWFGWKPEEVIGKNFLDYIHTQDIELLKNLIVELKNEPGESRVTECRCKDSTYKWIEITIANLLNNPLINGFLGNYRDITEKKKDQEHLKEAEKKYRLIFETSPFGLFYINSKGIIVDCNEAFISLTALSWGRLVGESLLDSPDAEVVLIAEKLLNGKSGDYEGEYHLIGSNKIIPVHIVYAPVFDSIGNVAGGVVIVEDITEKRITQRGVLDELEKERSRIGHILHDSLGQKLGAILYLVQAFRRKYNKTGGLSDDDIEKLSEVASSALEETRTLSRGLDFPLKDVGFIELLNDIVRKTVSVYGISVELNVNESIAEHDYVKLSNLYYIILESINNSIKHGNAEKIIFRYDKSNEENSFIIESFQSHDFKMGTPGMGLRIMKYRAEVAGMGFSIAAKGNRVIVTVEMGEKNVSE